MDVRSPCWNINYNDETKIFSDEFTNGLNVKLYEIGNVLISDNFFNGSTI